MLIRNILKTKSFKLILTCSFLIISTLCSAERSEIIEPILLGYAKCYDCYEHNKDEFCPLDYEHVSLVKGTTVYDSKAELINAFNNNLPKHTHCGWKTETTEQTSNDSTMFPFGYAKNFSQIGKDLRIVSACINNESGLNDDAVEEYAKTVFTCPSGYEYNQVLGCIKYTRSVCTGDIVGRQMTTNFLPLADQGHVGIVLRVTADDEKSLISGVFEVLKNNDVLNFTPLDLFKNASNGGYWGEKFGINKLGNLDFEQLIFMWDAISNIHHLQEKGIQLRYTFSSTPTFEPAGKFYIYDINSGAWLKTTNRPSLSFRCDSFVKYVFEKVKGIKFNLPILTPRNLFRSLFQIRNGHDPLLVMINDVSINPSDSEKYIRDFIIHDKYDNNYEGMIKGYIENKNISANRKLKFLIKILMQVSTSEEKLIYLIDIIMPLKPFRFFEEFKKISLECNSPLVKRYIDILLSESIKFRTEDEINNLNQSDIETIILIQKHIDAHTVISVKSYSIKKLLSAFEAQIKRMKIKHYMTEYK